MDSLRDLEISRAFPARRIHLSHGGERLVLRPTVSLDAEVITKAIHASLPELKQFMPWAHVPQTARAQLERLRHVEAANLSGQEMVLALYREGDPEMLTMVGLHPRTALNPSALELGYWASTPHAGKGWTTLAVRAMIVYAFDKLGADRVQVMCDQANAPSRRIIEKCGFALEGVMRNVTTPATPALIAGGYRGTGLHPMFGMFPDTYTIKPWVAEVRGGMTYENLAGHEIR